MTRFLLPFAMIVVAVVIAFAFRWTPSTLNGVPVAFDRWTGCYSLQVSGGQAVARFCPSRAIRFVPMPKLDLEMELAKVRAEENGTTVTEELAKIRGEKP